MSRGRSRGVYGSLHGEIMSKIMPHTGKRSRGGLAYLKKKEMDKAGFKIGDDLEKEISEGRIIPTKKDPLKQVRFNKGKLE